MQDLREQADRHRAARELTLNQRRYVAAHLYHWWRVGSPTGRAAADYARLDRARTIADEGLALYPDLLASYTRAVRARIERFEARRATPDLRLTPSGPEFVVAVYDNWGQRKGIEIKRGSREFRPSSQSIDWIDHLRRRPQWTDQDAKNAEIQIRYANMKGNAAPEWLRDAVRDYRRIEKRKGLVPTPAERQRYRKAAGLVKPRGKKVAS